MRPTTERRALGRGLGALLPSGARGDRATDYIECPLDRIRVRSEQPRGRFDEATLKELADSIRARGVLQPVVVSRDGDSFQLIAGERRVRAARMAGLRAVPAVVRELSADDSFEVALIENIQREDLDPMEEARAYGRLLASHGYTPDELAQRVGKSRPTVSNALRLLKLDARAQELISEGSLTPGHARALLSIAEEERPGLRECIVREGLSVREAERRAQQPRGSVGSPPRAPRRRRHLSELHDLVAQEISARLGTPVRVVPTSPRSGRLVIDYDSLDALRRIHQAITGAAQPSVAPEDEPR